jgi:hypothetical protein
VRTFVAATALVLVLSPAYASYGEKGHWDNVSGYTQGAPTVFDVSGDGIADIALIDTLSVSIFNGVSHQITWTIPFADPGMVVVANTDDDPAGELIISTLMFLEIGQPNPWHVAIYDCQSHTLELDLPLGYALLSVADVEGDSKADLVLADSLGGTKLVGWVGGGVDEARPVPGLAGLNALPAPAAGNVSFVLRASSAPGSLAIIDAAGRVVRTMSVPARPLASQVRWDCRDDDGSPVPAGTYIYRFGDATGKLEVIR